MSSEVSRRRCAGCVHALQISADIKNNGSRAKQAYPV
jgi:hypothetical protein